MDRRKFTKLALTGMGMALLPDTLGRAAVPATSTLPASPATTALAKMPYASLLERAKGALDHHRAAFELHDRIALADFSVASRELRFHIVDLIGGQSSSYLVSHGRGSDPEHSGWLKRFSNIPDSFASSNGAFKTGDLYFGQHGQSMRLAGLDPENNNAESRAIVIHGADYVSENHIATWGKIGRSEGCFAMAPHMLPQFLGLLGPGRMLYSDKV
jgi:hypothetical protein